MRPGAGCEMNQALARLWCCGTVRRREGEIKITLGEDLDSSIIREYLSQKNMIISRPLLPISAQQTFFCCQECYLYTASDTQFWVGISLLSAQSETVPVWKEAQQEVRQHSFIDGYIAAYLLYKDCTGMLGYTQPV